MYQAGARFRTTDMTYTVRDLAACESYMFDVAIVGPIGYGPGSGSMANIATEYDHRSPPKNVAVWPSRSGSRALAVINWRPPCGLVGTDPLGLGYRVDIRDEVVNMTSRHSLSASRNTSLQLAVEVHHGGQYTITVQTDVPGAKPSAPISFSGPPIPPPHQLRASATGEEGMPMLYWHDQDLPQEVAAHNYSYVVWMSPNNTFEVLSYLDYPELCAKYLSFRRIPTRRITM